MSDQPPSSPETTASGAPAEPAVDEAATGVIEPMAPSESAVVEVFDGPGAAAETDEGGAPEPSGAPSAAFSHGRGRTMLPWMAFAVVVIAAMVVALVLVLTTDRGSTAPTGVAEAREVLAGVIDGAEFTEAEATDIDCPVDLTTVVARLPVKEAAGELTGVGEFSAVLAPQASAVALVECSFEGDDGQLVGISLGLAPASDGFENTMKGFLSRHVLEFAESRSLREGTVFAYCGEPTAAAADAGFDQFCEADWVHGGLVVGVFASPDVLSAAQVGEWLEATLDMIVQQLAAT